MLSPALLIYYQSGTNRQTYRRSRYWTDREKNHNIHNTKNMKFIRTTNDKQVRTYLEGAVVLGTAADPCGGWPCDEWCCSGCTVGGDGSAGTL